MCTQTLMCKPMHMHTCIHARVHSCAHTLSLVKSTMWTPVAPIAQLEVLGPGDLRMQLLSPPDIHHCTGSQLRVTHTHMRAHSHTHTHMLKQDLATESEM